MIAPGNCRYGMNIKNKSKVRLLIWQIRADAVLALLLQPVSFSFRQKIPLGTLGCRWNCSNDGWHDERMATGRPVPMLVQYLIDRAN